MPISERMTKKKIIINTLELIEPHLGHSLPHLIDLVHLLSEADIWTFENMSLGPCRYLNSFFKIGFIFGCWCGLSLVAVIKGCSRSWCLGSPLQRLLSLQSTALESVGFSSCGTWALFSPQHVESSPTRDWTCVPCFGRRILNHWTTTEVLGACQYLKWSN